MISIFKKSAIALTVMGLAGTPYAGTFTGFFGGIEGTYLRASNGDLQYITESPAAPTTGQPITTISVPLNNHDWAYRLFGGMTFCGGDDVVASYLYYHTHDAGTVGTPPGSTVVRWLSPIFTYQNVNGYANFDLDDYYLEAGHTLQINEPWSIRLAGGLEYARLDSDMSVGAYIVDEPLAPRVGYTAKSGLRGFGPRMSLSTTYHLPYGFSVFGISNAALLVSHRNISLNTQTQLGEFGNFLPSTTFTERTPIVPKAGIRVGFGYNYTLGSTGGEGSASGASLSLEAGWQAEAYIHAIERPFSQQLLLSAVKSQQLPTVNNTQTTLSNYYYEGPFISATLNANWL